jgi:hypothetical protein
MTLTFNDLDSDESGVGKPIRSRAELAEMLESLKVRAPFFSELVGENSFKILMGFGGAIGCVQYSPSDGSPPYLMAVGAGLPDNREFMEFSISHTPSEVPARYCLPADNVMEIVLDFQETGAMSARFTWEEI